MKKDKLELTDTGQDILMKMSEGVIGAVEPLMKLMVLPMPNGIGVILCLDSMGIYGSDLYVLWNDVAQRKIWRFVALVRAAQLGILPKAELQAATQRDRDVQLNIDVQRVYLDVQERLNEPQGSEYNLPDYE